MTAPTPSPSAALPGAFQAHSLDQVMVALALAHGGTAAAADDAAEAPESDTFRHFSRTSGRLPAVPGRVACGDCAPSRGRLAAGRRLPSRAGCSSAGVSAVPVGLHPTALRSGWTAADGEPGTNCV